MARTDARRPAANPSVPSLHGAFGEPFDLTPYFVGVASVPAELRPPPAGEGGLFSVLCLIAAVGVGRAIQIADGCAHPVAWMWLGFSLLPVVALLVLRRRPGSESFQKFALPALAGMAFVLECAQLLGHDHPGGGRAPQAGIYFYLVISVALGLGLLGMRYAISPPSPRSRLHKLWFPGLLAIFAAFGVGLIRATPVSHIDVQLVQRTGLDAALQGRDPFSVTFPDIHHNPAIYPPGIVRDGIVHLGFPYPPLTLLLDLPAHALLGDYRYANLLCMVGTALLIAGCAPGGLAKLIAAVYLYTPRGFLVLECGWTEPQPAFFLAAAVYCACRVPRAFPIALGLLLASKQYMVLAAVPALLAVAGPRSFKSLLKTICVAGAVALAVSLPLILSSPRAFWASNFASVGNSPMRMDALSYLPLHVLLFGSQPPGWVGFAVALTVTALAVWRLPRTPAGFAAAVAAVCLGFFAFGKLAFCNYYYFIVAALCCAAAAAGRSLAAGNSDCGDNADRGIFGACSSAPLPPETSAA